MKTRSPHTKYTVILGVLLTVIIIYMGVLIGANYESRLNLRQAHLAHWKRECSDASDQIRYFLAEREEEAKNVVKSQTVENFFVNQSLGMSMQYGLGLSLENIGSYLKKYTKRKISGKYKLFTRMVLLLKKENLRIDTAEDKNILPQKPSWYKFYQPEKSAPELVALDEEGGKSIVISAPCLFDDEYRGVLLAWINEEALCSLFLNTEDVLGEAKLITNGKKYILVSANLDMQSIPAPGELIPHGRLPRKTQGNHFLNQKRQETVLSISCPIPDTNWKLIWIKPRKLLDAMINPWAIPVALAFFSLLVLAVILLLLKAGNKNTQLAARLEEGRKREQAIREKNELLREEIEKRKKIAQELEEHRRNLNRKVEEKTRVLNERLKEMDLLVKISGLSEDRKNSLEYILKKTAEFMPGAWQYPELTTAKITFKGREYASENYKRPYSFIEYPLNINGQKQGEIRVGYVKSNKQEHLNFLPEEEELLHLVCERIQKTIEYHDVVEKLRQTKNETEQLISSITSILISMDAGFIIYRWNQAAMDTFGIDSRAAVGKNILSLEIPWEKEKIQETLVSKKKQNIGPGLRDVNYTRPDGKNGILGITAHSIIEDGQLRGYLLLGVEITEKRAMQSQLSQSQKMKSLGQLAAGIAHEINTPAQYVGDNLHFIQDAFMDLLELIRLEDTLLDALEKDLTPTEYIEKIHIRREEIDFDFLKEEIPMALSQSLEGCGKIAGIVKSMKEFAHPGNQEKFQVDVNKVIHNTVNVARNEWKYDSELSMKLDEHLPQVPGFSSELGQVLLNIIVNAAQAISEKRQTEQLNEKGKIKIETYLNENSVAIRISDTGSGMPPEVRERVFDPFFTTKEVGRGIGQGMYISHQIIVDRLGGKIYVDSEPGNGSTFTIELPLE